jgi:hypothetical protein
MSGKHSNKMDDVDYRRYYTLSHDECELYNTSAGLSSFLDSPLSVILTAFDNTMRTGASFGIFH